MSNINTSIRLFHQASGTGSSNALNRESFDDFFRIELYELDTTGVIITSTLIDSPKDYYVENVTGDDILISLDNDSTYPIAIPAGEATLFGLDISGNVEISTIIAEADVSSNTSGLYFDLTDRSGFAARVWLNTGGVGTPPATPASGRLIAVETVADATDLVNAVAVAAALDADAEFISAVPTTATVTITDQHVGTRTNIVDGDTTWTVATTQQGAALPIVYGKSKGTSQVQVMVVPN